MSERTIDARVDAIAQALHAVQCNETLTARHSWAVHRDVAAKLADVLGHGVGNQRVVAAYQDGFNSRNDHVAELTERVAHLEVENTRLAGLLGETAGARKVVSDKYDRLVEMHTAEREECNNAVASAEASRRDLLIEKRLRIQAEDRSRVCSRELGDTYKQLADERDQLASAHDRIAVMDTSRLQLAEWLEHTTDFPSTGEEGTEGVAV